MLRTLAGVLAVAVLKLLSRFPPNLIVALGTPWLPFYALCRRSVRQRLNSLYSKVSNFPKPLAYYRMRLRLAALSLRHLTGYDDDLSVRVDGEEHYRAALVNRRPVALLGWHQGPVEMLHHLPPALDQRPSFILTGTGFAPALTRLLDRGRQQTDKRTISLQAQSAALRAWVRQRGVLAVMIDQVPGRPLHWLSLLNGKVEIPCPGNLVEWLREHNATCLAVSVRLDEDGILFRYQPVVPEIKALERLMEIGIGEAPGQYNWSYPKIRTA